MLREQAVYIYMCTNMLRPKHYRDVDSSVQGWNLYGCKACIGRRILDVCYMYE